MSYTDAVDVEARRVREAVLARHGLGPTDEIPLHRSGSAIEDVQRLATVSAHWGIASDAPFFGSILVLFRRILRILLRWYINPIVEQQNRFNQATVRALFELRSENEDLRAQLRRSLEAHDGTSE